MSPNYWAPGTGTADYFCVIMCLLTETNNDHETISAASLTTPTSHALHITHAHFKASEKTSYCCSALPSSYLAQLINAKECNSIQKRTQAPAWPLVDPPNYCSSVPFNIGHTVTPLMKDTNKQGSTLQSQAMAPHIYAGLLN
jgi:hypothetical protein